MKETIPRQDEEVTAATFEAWLKHARPGDRFEYHRGYLTADRVHVMNIPAIGGFAHVYMEPLHSLASAVWGAYERSKVLLVQQKLGPGVFRYLATKSTPARRGYVPPQKEKVHG